MKQNTCRLLNYSDRALKNDMMAVVIVNKAASVQESSKYGRSGLHYRGERWQISTGLGPKGYELYDYEYGSDRVTSAVFRKRTQAIHVTTLIPPSDNMGRSGNPRQPFDNPRSYLIGDECDPAPCSCLPGTQCAVGTFVECDCLPCKLRDILLADLPTSDEKRRWRGSDANPSQSLNLHYTEIRKQLLMLGCDRARELVDLLLHMHKDELNNPDMWSPLQCDAMIELLSALSVLRELQQVNFDTAPHWTASLGTSLAVALLDGEDGRHRWDEMELRYKKQFESRYYHPGARRKPVLLAMLRSRGLVTPLIKRSWLEFTVPADPNRLGDADSYTKATPLRFYVCQDAFFEGAKQAPTMTEFLQRTMRCIFGQGSVS